MELLTVTFLALISLHSGKVLRCKSDYFDVNAERLRSFKGTLSHIRNNGERKTVAGYVNGVA